MKPNSDFHFNQMTSSEPFKASGPTMVSITLEEYHALKNEITKSQIERDGWQAKKQLLNIKTHLLESAELEVEELKEEIKRLKAHVSDLNDDLNSAADECNKYHGEQ